MTKVELDPTLRLEIPPESELLQDKDQSKNIEKLVGLAQKTLSESTCWQTRRKMLKDGKELVLTGTEKKAVANYEDIEINQILSNIVGVYQEIYQKQARSSPEPAPKVEAMIADLSALAEEEYFYIFLGPNQSFIKTARDVLLVSYLMTQDEIRERAQLKKEDEVFFFFLELILSTLRRKRPPLLGQFMVVTQEFSADHRLAWEKYVSVIPREDSYYYPFYQRARANFKTSQERKKQADYSLPQVSFLSEIKILRGSKDSESLSYWDIYGLFYGLNSQNRQYTLRELKKLYPVFKNTQSISGIISFVERVLGGTFSWATIDNDGRVKVDAEFFEKGEEAPLVAQLEIKRILVEQKRESLKLLEEDNKRQEEYRSSGVLEFDELLLETFIDEVRKRNVVSSVRLDLHKENVFGDVAAKASQKLHEKYPKGRFPVSASAAKERIMILCGLTRSPFLIEARKGTSSLTRKGKQKDAGLFIEDAIVAIEMLYALESGDFSRLSVKILPTDWLFAKWKKKKNDRWEIVADDLGIPFTSLQFLGNAAIANKILAGETEDILALQKRFRHRRPGFFQAVSEFDHKATEQEKVRQALIAVLQIEPGRLLQTLIRKGVEFNARMMETIKPDLRLEYFVLRKTAEGYPGSEMVKELDIPLNQMKMAVVTFTELKKYLVRYPLKWRELISTSNLRG